MLKRIFKFLLILLALFYAGAGIYFYKKSFRKKTTVEVPKTVSAYSDSDLVVKKETFLDFEDAQSENKWPISSDKFFSGKKSIKITSDTEYGAEIIQSFSEIPTLTDFRQVEVTMKVWNDRVNEGAVWVIEVNGEDLKVLEWHPEDIPTTLHKWESCMFRFDIKPEHLKNFNRIKTYAWNRSKNTFYIDDVRIRFLGLQSDNNNSTYASLHPSSFFFDLENDSSLERTESLSDDFSHSGKRSSFMSGKNEYSVFIGKKLSEVMNDTITSLSASVWLYCLSDNPKCKLVFEVRDEDDEQIYWNGKSTETLNLKANTWNKLNAIFNVGPDEYKKFNANDNLYVYVLNNSRSKLYADDFEISYGPIPEKRGMQVFVDMNSLQPDAYEFNRYHPPFAVSHLQQKNIQNGNSYFLIDKDSIRYGDLKPDQYMSTGNFTGQAGNKDELLAFADNKINFFSYCESKGRFTLVGTASPESNVFPNAIFTTGDFNGDGKTDLIVSNGNLSSMFTFSTSGGKKCSDNVQAISLKSIWNGELSHAKIIAGKFGGNKSDEIFISELSGRCFIKKFNGESWITVSENVFPTSMFGKKSTLVSGRFFNSTSDLLLTVYNEKGQTHCSLLELEKGKIVEKNFPDMEMAVNIFDWNDVLLKIKSNNNNDDILAFKNQWRFELKYISTDSKGFYVSSVPEFTGFPSDQNPKYYEFPKLIPGRFTGNETEILSVLYNCADKNFNGNHCIKYDSIPDLPNSIQLYNFSK